MEVKSNPMISQALLYDSSQGSVITDLQEAERFFNWALDYDNKGLSIAAESLRDEGRKSFARHLASMKLISSAL